MRLFLLVLTAFTLVSGLAWADEKDTIDTGKGLTFQKESGWAKAKNAKGVVAALNAAGDEESQIEFRWAEVDPKKAKQYFNSFHASLVGAKLKKVGEPAQKTYGKVSGTLTEYEAATKNGSTRIFVFQFANGGAAWLVVGMFDGKRRDQYLGDYEKMLATIKF